MASSGTYAYSPDLADLIDEAWERCGLDPALITGRHVRSARRSIDLLFSEWDTRGIRLWGVDEQTQTLTQADATYTATTGTQAILDMFVRRSSIDTMITPMARDEYAEVPDKTTQGLPSRYWYNKASNEFTLWQVPENSTDVVHYYRIRRIQDGGVISNTPDVPALWLEAFAAGLAAKFSGKWAKEREDTLTLKAERAFRFATGEDRERASTRISRRLRG